MFIILSFAMIVNLLHIPPFSLLDMHFLAHPFDKNSENPASKEKFLSTGGWHALSPSDRHALAKPAISFV